MEPVLSEAGVVGLDELSLNFECSLVFTYILLGGLLA